MNHKQSILIEYFWLSDMITRDSKIAKEQVVAIGISALSLVLFIDF